MDVVEACDFCSCEQIVSISSADTSNTLALAVLHHYIQFHKSWGQLSTSRSKLKTSFPITTSHAVIDDPRQRLHLHLVCMKYKYICVVFIPFHPSWIHSTRLHYVDCAGGMNSLLLPTNLGGAFHAGVEVGGLEWSFGLNTEYALKSGVQCVLPQRDSQHNFRQTVPLEGLRVCRE